MTGAGAPAPGQEPDPPVDRYAIPATVSPEAAAALKTLYFLKAGLPDPGPPETIADWDERNLIVEIPVAILGSAVAASLGVTVATGDTLGGVPVVRVRPAGYRPGSRLLVYVHGGGYVSLSARTALVVPAQLAAATGCEVISVDYTLAPDRDWPRGMRRSWQVAIDEMLSVWRALLDGGARPDAIGLGGDSAGGGLAAGSVLKMRDEGLSLPGALHLLSPWSDITLTGDSYATLAAADPLLSLDEIEWDGNAYADPADQKHPYVSPVYGDYSKPFPTTLIQVGTREIFLSNAVRHYQAIRLGGHEAVLDVYEGMPHVFQFAIPGTPEADTAIRRAAQFFDAHLAR
jgi:acetyl esterase/lipase